MVKKQILSEYEELHRRVHILKARVDAIDKQIDILQNEVLPELLHDKEVLKTTLKEYTHKMDSKCT